MQAKITSEHKRAQETESLHFVWPVGLHSATPMGTAVALQFSFRDGKVPGINARSREELLR